MSELLRRRTPPRTQFDCQTSSVSMMTTRDPVRCTVLVLGPEPLLPLPPGRPLSRTTSSGRSSPRRRGLVRRVTRWGTRRKPGHVLGRDWSRPGTLTGYCVLNRSITGSRTPEIQRISVHFRNGLTCVGRLEGLRDVTPRRSHAHPSKGRAGTSSPRSQRRPSTLEESL